MPNCPMQSSLFRYKGAIHIHTKFSDGTGDIDTISKAAKKNGLDWIIITDHNSLDAEEGIFNGVYVLKGEEISPENKNNHYLALDIKNLIEPNICPQTNVDNVKAQGGFGFAAHPDEGVNGRNNKWAPIVWTDKNIIPDGVEIWNWFSNWGDSLNDRNLFNLAYSYLFKNKIISNPHKETLVWWDKLNNTDKIVPAIGGVDAHALKIQKYILPVTVFPYNTCFETIVNIIELNKPLSNDFEQSKRQILDAIKAGNNVIVNRKICKNIPFVSITNGKDEVFCGQKIKLTDETFLKIQTDKNVEIRLICNGKLIGKINSDNVNYHITKTGKYRLEFTIKDKDFAFTNHICVV